jgi:hypothetical protein
VAISVNGKLMTSFCSAEEDIMPIPFKRLCLGSDPLVVYDPALHPQI